MPPDIVTHTEINDETNVDAIKNLNVNGSPGRDGMSPFEKKILSG